MTDKGFSHLTSGWLTHVVAASSIVVLVSLLGVPSTDAPAVQRGQERGVAELASLLAAQQPKRDRIEENVRSWSRFPPGGGTDRRLAGALASCTMSSRPDAERVDLARRLYAITNGTDVSDDELAGTLAAFRRAAAAARCAPRATADLTNVLRRVARSDPRPRTDWW